MSFGKFVFGSLVGGAIGAVVGMMLAPRPGRETRKILVDEIEERYDVTLNSVSDKIHEKTEAFQEKVEAITDSAEALKEKARQIADQLEETGRKTVESISSRGSKPSKA